MKEPKPNQYVIIQAKALKALVAKYFERTQPHSEALMVEVKRQTTALERIAACLEAEARRA